MRISKLFSIFEDQTAENIANSLEGKTLIIFILKATGVDPSQDYVQITNIAAIAVDPDGNEIDAFNEEAALGLAVLHRIDHEDRLLRADEWPQGEMGVRDWLNAADYDLAAEEEHLVDKPEELDVVMHFKEFLDQYTNSILITYNSKLAMSHLDAKSPVPISRFGIIDVPEFAKSYFEPVLRSMMTKGNRQAAEMADKMWDNMKKEIDPTLHNLSRAFGISKAKHSGTIVGEVRQLSSVFSKMLKFVRRNVGASKPS